MNNCSFRLHLTLPVQYVTAGVALQTLLHLSQILLLCITIRMCIVYHLKSLDFGRRCCAHRDS